MKNTTLTFTLLTFLSFSVANAQNPIFDWAIQAEGSSNSKPKTGETKAIAIDSAGNIYATGTFAGKQDFDPGPDTMYLTSTGQGIYAITDIFVQKLDKNGNLIWAFSVGSIESDWPVAIELDPFGDILISGIYKDDADFDPGPDTSLLTSYRNTDLNKFVLKVDANGNFIWVKGFNDPGMTGSIHGFTVDDSANVFLFGLFSSEVDFDLGPDTTILYSSYTSFFVVKLNRQGDFQWVKPFFARVPGGSSAISAVTDSSGDIILSGSYKGKYDFDPGPDSLFFFTENAQPFIAKLNQTGDLIWAKTINNNNEIKFELTRAICTDHVGNIYHVHDHDPGVQKQDGSVITKRLPNGTIAWSDTITAYIRSIVVDIDENVYLTGSFGLGIHDVDPGPDRKGLYWWGGNDIIVEKLDKDGLFLWAFSIGGSGNDGGATIALDSKQNFLIGGAFDNVVDFDPGPDTLYLDVGDTRTSHGSNFIAKFHKRWSTGFEDIGLWKTIRIFPNPTSDFLKIEIEEKKMDQITIFDHAGKLIRQYTSPASRINVHDLPTGIYYLQLRQGNSSYTSKFVKR